MRLLFYFSFLSDHIDELFLTWSSRSRVTDRIAPLKCLFSNSYRRSLQRSKKKRNLCLKVSLDRRRPRSRRPSPRLRRPRRLRRRLRLLRVRAMRIRSRMECLYWTSWQLSRRKSPRRRLWSPQPQGNRRALSLRLLPRVVIAYLSRIVCHIIFLSYFLCFLGF